MKFLIASFTLFVLLFSTACGPDAQAGNEGDNNQPAIQQPKPISLETIKATPTSALIPTATLPTDPSANVLEPAYFLKLGSLQCPIYSNGDGLSLGACNIPADKVGTFANFKFLNPQGGYATPALASGPNAAVIGGNFASCPYKPSASYCGLNLGGKSFNIPLPAGITPGGAGHDGLGGSGGSGTGGGGPTGGDGGGGTGTGN